MAQTEQGQTEQARQNSGLSDRAHWKNTILADIAAFPGASRIQEAVFEVGSGAHQFAGPAMTG